MGDLFRDTVVGHLVRWVSKGKLLPHPEDKDNRLWKKYVHEEKTARMAHHGHTEEEETQEKEGEGGVNHNSSQESSRTRLEESEHRRNDVGMKVDPEKGKDWNVIHFEENDPEVRIQHASYTMEIILAKYHSPGPNELVPIQKGLRDGRDMPPNHIRLHRLRHLHRRQRRRNDAVRSIPNSRKQASNILILLLPPHPPS